nr:hypothetical protein [Halapricum sp. CBA1109]
MWVYGRATLLYELDASSTFVSRLSASAAATTDPLRETPAVQWTKTTWSSASNASSVSAAVSKSS